MNIGLFDEHRFCFYEIYTSLFTHFYLKRIIISLLAQKSKTTDERIKVALRIRPPLNREFHKERVDITIGL